MSEPVTHAEIEDVLSSIRRLVSETGRAEEAGAVSRERAQPVTRLVLTPALRVPEAELATMPDHSPTASPQVTSSQTANGVDGSDAEPPRVNQVAAAMKARFEGDPEERRAAEAPFSKTSVAVSAQDIAAPPFKRPDLAAQVVARVKLRGVAGLTTDAQPADAADTTATDTTQENPTDRVTPWRDPGARLFEAAEETDAAENVAEAADDAARAAISSPEPSASELRAREQSARVAAVVRRIAELETETRSEAPNPTPTVPDLNEDEIDEVPSSGAMEAAPEWRDPPQDSGTGAAAAPEVNPRDAGQGSAQAVVQQAAQEATFSALAERAEDFLDEESLRQLVADIVRQELQGPLGERITRNVRKLVRREIQRALAAQDLL